MTPHPDDDTHTKFSQICTLIDAASHEMAKDISDVYVWIDFASVDQDDAVLLSRGINSLPVYVSMADMVISMSNHDEYYERAW